jgi:hypothetical protein
MLTDWHHTSPLCVWKHVSSFVECEVIHQIFCVHEILEKKYWAYIQTPHQLFIDHKKACDYFGEVVLYSIVSYFVVPVKLVKPNHYVYMKPIVKSV